MLAVQALPFASVSNKPTHMAELSLDSSPCQAWLQLMCEERDGQETPHWTTRPPDSRRTGECRSIPMVFNRCERPISITQSVLFRGRYPAPSIYPSHIYMPFMALIMRSNLLTSSSCSSDNLYFIFQSAPTFLITCSLIHLWQI